MTKKQRQIRRLMVMGLSKKEALERITEVEKHRNRELVKDFIATSQTLKMDVTIPE